MQLGSPYRRLQPWYFPWGQGWACGVVHHVFPSPFLALPFGKTAQQTQMKGLPVLRGVDPEEWDLLGNVQQGSWPRW